MSHENVSDPLRTNIDNALSIKRGCESDITRLTSPFGLRDGSVDESQFETWQTILVNAAKGEEGNLLYKVVWYIRWP